MAREPEPLELDTEVAKQLLDNLMGFATWRTTPQGFDYWDQVHKNVEAMIESTVPGKTEVEFEKIAGPRFVSIDLDVVITADLRPLWNRPEDFVRDDSK